MTKPLNGMTPRRPSWPLTVSTAAVAVVGGCGPPAAAKAQGQAARVDTGLLRHRHQHQCRAHGRPMGQKLLRRLAPSGATLTFLCVSRVLSASGKPVTSIGRSPAAGRPCPATPGVLSLGGVPTVAMAGTTRRHGRPAERPDPQLHPLTPRRGRRRRARSLTPLGAQRRLRLRRGRQRRRRTDLGRRHASTDHVTVHYGIDPAVPAAGRRPAGAPTGVSDIDDVSVVRDSKSPAWSTPCGTPCPVRPRSRASTAQRSTPASGHRRRRRRSRR